MSKERASLANQAVVKLWSLAGHGKKPPLSTPAIAVCQAADERLIGLEERIERLERKVAGLDKASQPE